MQNSFTFAHPYIDCGFKMNLISRLTKCRKISILIFFKSDEREELKKLNVFNFFSRLIWERKVDMH